MHRQFSQLLPDAEGDSKLVIVVNVDVRDFSEFSERVESVQAALFIRRVFIRLLSDYFQDAAFYKSTGDGMLVVFHVDEASIVKQLEDILKRCLAIAENFPDITNDDPLINFPVPTNVGIGLARGAASRLIAGDTVLDYSGRTLNLASRLMEFARPEGVVVDGAYGLDLLSDEVQALFQGDRIYIKSVALREPRSIFTLSGRVVIPESARAPFDDPVWDEISQSYPTLKAFKAQGVWFYFPVKEVWLDADGKPAADVTFTHPAIGPGGKKHPQGIVTAVTVPAGQWRHEQKAAEHRFSVNIQEIANRCHAKGVKLTWGPVYLRIAYRTA